MLRSLTTFFVFQLIGEVLSFGLRAPIPGPVFGMSLLVGYLLLRPGEAETLRPTAQELLRHLSLLFVPAGVGVMLYLDTVKKEWLPISLSLIASTVLTIAVTALTMRAVHRRMNGPAGDKNPSAPPAATAERRDESPR
jgi:holin-like protein